MITDPIANYLTTIRNGIKAGHTYVRVPFSNIKQEISKVLVEQGYLSNWHVMQNQDGFKELVLTLKYTSRKRVSPILKISRISKPGRRCYSHAKELPHVLNGLGIAIVSTSQGVMSDKEARKRNIGGELICQVY